MLRFVGVLSLHDLCLSVTAVTAVTLYVYVITSSANTTENPAWAVYSLQCANAMVTFKLLSFLCFLVHRLPTQAGWVGCESSVLTLHDQWEVASFKWHVQVLHMQTPGGPSPTEGREPLPGWMALYPESRYMLTLASAAARLVWPQPQSVGFAASARSVYAPIPFDILLEKLTFWHRSAPCLSRRSLALSDLTNSGLAVC